MARVPILLATLLLAGKAAAWDTNTHKVIGVIAYRRLTPQAKAWCDRILATNQRGYTDFLNAAPYPDYLKHGSPRKDVKKVRRFDGWHYVDFPVVKGQGWTVPRDLSVERNGNNALYGIGECATNITRGQAETRGFYLAMLIHLVGDVHQPLHCAERDGDRGGNDFELRGSLRNLHSLWDGAITAKYRLKGKKNSTDERIRRVARDVQNNYPLEGMRDEVAILDPHEWAMESYALAVDSAYDGIEPRAFPTEPYKRRWTAVAERQVALAGYRLAAFLNKMAPR